MIASRKSTASKARLLAVVLLPVGAALLMYSYAPYELDLSSAIPEQQTTARLYAYTSECMDRCAAVVCQITPPAELTEACCAQTGIAGGTSSESIACFLIGSGYVSATPSSSGELDDEPRPG